GSGQSGNCRWRPSLLSSTSRDKAASLLAQTILACPRVAGQKCPLYCRLMILLRHGQSEFNLHFSATRRDPGIPDPRLTELGHAQAAEAARRLAGERVARIIASPYTRSLQTATPLSRSLGVKVVINPIVRERYAFACDIGTPRTELERTWPEL